MLRAMKKLPLTKFNGIHEAVEADVRKSIRYIAET